MQPIFSSLRCNCSIEGYNIFHLTLTELTIFDNRGRDVSDVASLFFLNRHLPPLFLEFESRRVATVSRRSDLYLRVTSINQCIFKVKCGTFSYMNIKRAKGHGRYATLSVEVPELSQGWHIKLRPASDSIKLADEAERTRWAQGHLPAPEKAYFRRLPGVAMLITKTLDGTPSYKYIDVLEPRALISGVSSAVQTMRRVDVTDFPFAPPRWATEQGATENVGNLAVSGSRHRELHPDFAGRTLRELKDVIDAGPGEGEQVLSHGDLCMPNALLDEVGTLTGIVDLGGLHVGSAALDPAIMSWTVQASMGDRWANQLLEMQGTNANDPAILYNRLAYDLGLERPDPWAWTQTPQLAEQRERLSA
jgi:aminoglycoside phosphotransferase